MSPFVSARRGLSALAFILALAFPTMVARADISTTPNATSLAAAADTADDSSLAASLGGANVLDAFTNLTKAQQSAILARYSAIQTEITTATAQATTMRTALDSGKNTDTTNTEAAYQLLIQKIADKTADRDALGAWIAQKPIQPIDDGYDNSSNSNSGGGSGGSQNPFSGIAQQVASSMMGDLLKGGQPGNLLGGLGMGGGSGAGMGGGTGGGNTNKPAPGNPKAADKKEATQDPCEPTNPGKEAAAAKAKPDAAEHGLGKETPTDMTSSHPGKAADDYVGGGQDQTSVNPGKAKDDIVAKKPSPCKASDYTTPNPNADAIRAKLDAIIASGQFQCNKAVTRCSYKDPESGKWIRANGEACVAFAQAWDPSVGPASNWYSDGRQVIDGGFKPGDIVATANDPGSSDSSTGKYCTVVDKSCGVPGANRYHVVVFDSYLDDAHPEKGFIGVGQAINQVPYKSTFVPGPGGEDGDKYFGIRKGPAFVSQYLPLPSSMWLALQLAPLYEALLKV